MLIIGRLWRLGEACLLTFDFGIGLIAGSSFDIRYSSEEEDPPKFLYARVSLIDPVISSSVFSPWRFLYLRLKKGCPGSEWEKVTILRSIQDNWK